MINCGDSQGLVVTGLSLSAVSGNYSIVWKKLSKKAINYSVVNCKINVGFYERHILEMPQFFLVPH